MNGAAVAGTSVVVSAAASDNVGVAGVQFTLDGNPLGAEITTAPYTVTWNTTQTADGSHVLTAAARDVTGNTATSTSVTVTVNNDTSSLTADDNNFRRILTTSAASYLSAGGRRPSPRAETRRSIRVHYRIGRYPCRSGRTR